MTRKHNTSREGTAWTPEQIKSNWEKGREIPEYNPNEWRWDKCGNVMNFNQHGDRTAKFGWEIDHIDPVANGGKDEDTNLQPLYWRNNANKSDNPKWSCPNPQLDNE